MRNETRLPSKKRQALCYVGFQAAVVLCVAFIVGVMGGWLAAQSALLAGCICVGANTLFVTRLFNYRGARQARQFILAFYTGEIAKLALMVTLMVMVMAIFPVKMLPFLLTIVLAQSLMSAAPLVMRRVY